MTKKLLALLLLQLTLQASATEFSLTIKEPFDSAILDITQDYDRDISAVGFSQNFYKRQTTKSYNNAFDYLAAKKSRDGLVMHLVKVDSSADLLLSKKYPLSGVNRAVSIIKTPSNGYFIGGYSLSGSLIVLKLKSDAKELFYREFGTANYDKMNHLVSLRDGGVLAVGTSTTTRSKKDNIFETGLGKSDIYISRFSKSGSLLWSKKYGTQNDDSGVDAVEANDGSLIIVGGSYNGKTNETLLIRTTQNGDKLWLKRYTTQTRTVPKKLLKLQDHNFLLSLSQLDDMSKEQIRLIKFDINNNVLIDRTINSTYSSLLNDIGEFSDSKIIGVGYVKDRYNTDALAMLLDSNLNLLKQEHYGDKNRDLFNALDILNNSQVIVGGLKRSKNSQESNMWIVKLNSDLTIAKKVTKRELPLQKFKNLFSNELLAKKVTISKDFDITFLDKSLYFTQGKYELTPKQKRFLDSFTQKLIPFLKKHIKSIKSLEINGHASSEWSHTNFSKRYLKNEKLSMSRSYAVLSYIFSKADKETQKMLSKILRSSGYSSAKRVMSKKEEDKENSRRVSFKIIMQ
jgi:outer membrane protein OmpA-like peptidoglycan-associated protein